MRIGHTMCAGAFDVKGEGEFTARFALLRRARMARGMPRPQACASRRWVAARRCADPAPKLGSGAGIWQAGAVERIAMFKRLLLGLPIAKANASTPVVRPGDP